MSTGRVLIVCVLTLTAGCTREPALPPLPDVPAVLRPQFPTIIDDPFVPLHHPTPAELSDVPDVDVCGLLMNPQAYDRRWIRLDGLYQWALGPTDGPASRLTGADCLQVPLSIMFTYFGTYFSTREVGLSRGLPSSEIRSVRVVGEFRYRLASPTGCDLLIAHELQRAKVWIPAGGASERPWPESDTRCRAADR